jgi:hypothetical protein
VTPRRYIIRWLMKPINAALLAHLVCDSPARVQNCVTLRLAFAKMDFIAQTVLDDKFGYILVTCGPDAVANRGRSHAFQFNHLPASLSPSILQPQP